MPPISESWKVPKLHNSNPNDGFSMNSVLWVIFLGIILYKVFN